MNEITEFSKASVSELKTVDTVILDSNVMKWLRSESLNGSIGRLALTLPTGGSVSQRITGTTREMQLRSILASFCLLLLAMSVMRLVIRFVSRSSFAMSGVYFQH